MNEENKTPAAPADPIAEGTLARLKAETAAAVAIAKNNEKEAAWRPWVNTAIIGTAAVIATGTIIGIIRSFKTGSEE